MPMAGRASASWGPGIYFMNVQANQTLAAAVWPAQDMSGTQKLIRFVALAIAGTLALNLSAKLQVPLPVVPLTLQTLVVLVLGASFGLRLSLASVSLYLLEGLVNLPVFAGTPEKGIGLPYMMGPTGGFLAGFLVAAAFIGFCAERGWDKTWWKLLAVMSVGHALIFTLGFAWLAKLIGPQKAFDLGVEPFLAATLIKTLLATAIVPGLWKLAGSLRG